MSHLLGIQKACSEGVAQPREHQHSLPGMKARRSHAVGGVRGRSGAQMSGLLAWQLASVHLPIPGPNSTP